MAETSENIQGWVDRLSEAEVPVLSHTVQRIGAAAGNHETSARDLANIILGDAAMTSGVLRVANSAYYGSASREISTISRAVVLLGFETVRAIGTSVAIIETFLKGRTTAPLLAVMRDSVHAAVQARAIAAMSGDNEPEEVFVAALLTRLGEMAFWAFADDAQAESLSAALGEPGRTRRQAEKEVLGFTLRDLTRSLARAWNLGDLVQEAVDDKARQTPRRARSVQLGHELQTAIRSRGLESREVERVLHKVGEHSGQPAKRVTERIVDSLEEVKVAAKAFGVSSEITDHDAAAEGEDAADESGPQPSPKLQLRILRELTQMRKEQPDLQAILDMVLEGIYRGVGVDRTLVAILSRDRQRLNVRYTLGDSGALRQAFDFTLDDAGHRVFRRALSELRPLWAAQLPPTEQRRCISPDIQQRFAADFFLAPLAVRGRDIGLLYADRRTSGRAMDEESFEAFSHFAEECSAAIEQLSRG